MITKILFSAHIENIWNSLPNYDVDVKYDFTADLTGTGDRSVHEICEV